MLQGLPKAKPQIDPQELIAHDEWLRNPITRRLVDHLRAGAADQEKILLTNYGNLDEAAIKIMLSALNTTKSILQCLLKPLPPQTPPQP